MTITVDDSKIVTIDQVKEILKSSDNLQFKGVTREGKYRWVSQTLKRFDYASLKKQAKGLVRVYLQRLSGFSRAQITRLIDRRLSTGRLIVTAQPRHRFTTLYTTADRQLLARVDNAHQRLSGPATRRLLERAYDVHGDKRFERLKNISSAHIYNLRATPAYQRLAYTFAGTKSVRVAIGIRRRPDPQGPTGLDPRGHRSPRRSRPKEGRLSHQSGRCRYPVGNRSVRRTNRRTLPRPRPGRCTEHVPFRILGFHSDNGSEYINRIVASLLNKLLIEQTKSRAGRTNDNALVEGKNGSGSASTWATATSHPAMRGQSTSFTARTSTGISISTAPAVLRLSRSTVVGNVAGNTRPTRRLTNGSAQSQRLPGFYVPA
ncbi:MAG: integrase [Elusimicrobia bacterium]|nr:integrase [Elusimicrobiota bacterium]